MANGTSTVSPKKVGASKVTKKQKVELKSKSQQKQKNNLSILETRTPSTSSASGSDSNDGHSQRSSSSLSSSTPPSPIVTRGDYTIDIRVGDGGVKDDYDDSPNAHLMRALAGQDKRGETFDPSKMSETLRFGKSEIYTKFCDVQFGLLWKPSSLPLGKDITQMKNPPKTLTPKLRKLVKQALIFFAASDAQVIENVSQNFAHELMSLPMFTPEERLDIGFWIPLQTLAEEVHGVSYDWMLSVFENNREKRKKLIDDVQNHPALSAKYSCVNRWMNVKIPIYYRIFFQVLIEGLFFSGSFSLLSWIRTNHPDLLIGICLGNGYILKDEGLHRKFFIYIIKRIRKWLMEHNEDLDHTIIRAMIEQVVQAEIEFFIEGLVDRKDKAIDAKKPKGRADKPMNIMDCHALGIPGLTVRQMHAYIKSLADDILDDCGFEPMYKISNPLPHTLEMAKSAETNFFEKDHIMEYQKKISSDSIGQESKANGDQPSWVSSMDFLSRRKQLDDEDEDEEMESTASSSSSGSPTKPMRINYTSGPPE